MNADREDGFDPVQLRTFVTVAEARSFAHAARLLQLGPSTVSQHVRKLERACGRVLLERDTHRVALTVDGEAMLGFAHNILDSQAVARDYFAASRPRGRVRFGISEDFAQVRLPGILRTLRQRYPDVDVELTVALSGVLYQRMRARDLDLILAKQVADAHPSDVRIVQRDRLVWLGTPELALRPGEPIPLILYPEPSVTRAVALKVLHERGVPFRTACTASSLSGLRAAALAGLGLLPHSQSLAPPELGRVTAGLPDLGSIDLGLITRRRTPNPAEHALIQIITGT
ncbi:LysR family transcriptional regulator [Dactylosporangium sp. NPDC048998]|uniref:LysR family transcriptional regulator n=1 Tax=Dactylosporangium sp. NPDC048998 TaxID=3363976 RepID=UPI00372315C9